MSYFDDASLVMIPSGYKNQKVYSVKPLDGSGDLTFSRASSATRVDSNGLIEKVRTNLMTYSNDFTNAAWSAITNGTYTLTTETITDPFGNSVSVAKVTLTSGGYLVLRNVLASSTSSPTTGSVYIKKTNSATGVDIDLSDQPSPAAASNTNWQRLEAVNPSSVYGSGTFLDINITTVNQPVYIAYAQVELSDFGATDYIATTSAAVSVGPVSGLPRLDYLNSTCPRLILEPQRTNALVYSEQVNAAFTSQSSAGTGAFTITSNYGVSPDGYQNADRIQMSATGAGSYVDILYPSFTPVSGTVYTYSVYIKSLSGTPVVGFLYDGTSNRFITTSTTWTRYTFTFTGGAVAYPRFVCEPPSTGTNIDILVWGWQLEAGAYATSYIPTLGTSVTRVWDDASKTGITSLIGQTAGTLFVELNADGRSNATARVIAYLTANGSTDNRVAIQYNASGQIQAIASSGGSTQGSVAYTITGPCKAAFAYNSSGYELFVNGVSRGTFTGSLPTSLTRLDMNSLAGTFDELGGTINQVLIFKTRLSNSDLATLTTL